MKTVRFAKHYTKLDESSFTTIRKHKKDILNQTVKIVSPDPRFNIKEIKIGSQEINVEDASLLREFTAKCTKIEKTKLILIDFDLLKKDTDTKSIYEGFLELKKYYPELTMETYVFIYYFEKVDFDES